MLSSKAAADWNPLSVGPGQSAVTVTPVPSNSLAMASEKQKIIYGKNKIFESKEVLEIFPQSLIVIGKTNEKEKEALNKFFA